MLSVAYFFTNVVNNLLNRPHDRRDNSDQCEDMLKLVQRHIKQASLVCRKKVKLVKELSPHECFKSALWPSRSAGWLESPLLQNDLKEMAAVRPPVYMTLNDWTSYLDQQNYPVLNPPLDDSKCFVLFEAVEPENAESLLETILSVSPQKRKKISDFVTPIAWKAGNPFGIIAECTEEKFTQLADSFMTGNLFMDDLLELTSLTTVHLHGHAVNLLRTDSRHEDLNIAPGSESFNRFVPFPSPSGTWELSDDHPPIAEQDILSSRHGSNESLAADQEELQDIDNIEADIEDNLPISINFTPSGTALIEFNDEYQLDGLDQGGEFGGEAFSPSMEELAPELLTPAKRLETIKSKPPNILIYSGKKDAGRLYNITKSIFEQCINRDKYVLYHLRHEQILSTPWADNAALLLICSEKVYDGRDKVFFEYFKKGGTVISFNSLFDKMLIQKNEQGRGMGVLNLDYEKWQGVSVICGKHNYNGCDMFVDNVSVEVIGTDKASGNAVMIEVVDEDSGGVAILSQVNLDKDPMEMAISPEIFTILKKANTERFEILKNLLSRVGVDSHPGQLPALTPCFLFTINEAQNTAFLQSVEPRLKDNVLKSAKLSLYFVDSQSQADSLEPTAEILPVIRESSDCKFDLLTYRENLDSQQLGNTVMYVDVISTTMNLFDSLMYAVPDEVGLIAIANRQISGQGRGENAWLSPAGCAMFSLHVRLSLDSTLGQRVSYIQHITSLAVVEAVRTMPGYEDIDLRLKWPNDIYFGSSMKIGGVIVKSSVMRRDIHINIGCGFNVSNKNPTICINDLVELNNVACQTSLKAFSTEQLIARTVSKIDSLIKQFQEEGKDAFLEKYYKYWLHSDAEVTLTEEKECAKIMGLDEYGFLLVKTANGEVRSVHPDGNSFDMMKGLIVPKS